MSTRIENAKKCFNDNWQRFKHDPEKHDLYAGLYNLAVAVEEMQRHIEFLQRQVDNLERHK